MISKLINSRPYINLAALLAVCISAFFIYTLSVKIKEADAKQAYFKNQSILPYLTQLPLPIDYKPNAYQGLIFRKVRLNGHFLIDHEIYLENRVAEDSPKSNIKKSLGFHVIMPFQLDEGPIVWVNRGWIGRDLSNRQNIPDASPPSYIHSIKGYITPGHKDILQMPPKPPHMAHGHVVALNFYLHDDKKELPNRNVYPFLITQTSDDSDGLARPEESYYFSPDYSFDLETWWVILCVTITYWLISGFIFVNRNKAN